MKLKVKPTEKPEILMENLKKRVEDVEKNGEELVVETGNPGKLEKVPGVDSFESEEEQTDGLGGRPVDEEAYARIESREDAVKAFLATVKGYDLRILETDREWDLKNLKRYNPDIKHLKFEEPSEVLGIGKTISPVEGSSVEKIEIEMPEEDVETIYRRFLT